MLGGIYVSTTQWEAPWRKHTTARRSSGMDLHRRRVVLVRMAEDGRKLETAGSPTARRGWRPRSAGRAAPAGGAGGDCYGWYWAADTLAAAGAEVHLAHPLGVKAFSHRRVKNDELDARDLADLLRMGRLPEAWIAPAEIRELREITRYRAKLVQQRTCSRTRSTACWPSSASR